MNKDQKPNQIDMTIPPKKPNYFWRFLIHAILGFYNLTNDVKMESINCENLKWPYIIISSHASFVDFAWLAKATYPHNSTYICSIEEFVGREYLMRSIGAYPKRKFTNDIGNVRKCLETIRKKKNAITIFPEARYSMCGITERMDKSLGKFAKLAGVPVVVTVLHGDYLNDPQWDQKHKRKVPFRIVKNCVATQEEVKTLSAEEIQDRIEKAMQYNEYQWQRENDIHIKSKFRAHGIHNILYKCPHCMKDYTMRSEGCKLWCTECGAEYEMDELSILKRTNGQTAFEYPDEWYKWEREECRKEVDSNNYNFTQKVRIEHLGTAQKGFEYLGHVDFTHDDNGIHLHGTLDNGEKFDFDNSPENTSSIHLDYHFKKKGTVNRNQALDINTLDDTWFIYFETDVPYVTKINFAVEHLYDKYCREHGLKKKTT